MAYIDSILVSTLDVIMSMRNIQAQCHKKKRYGAGALLAVDFESLQLKRCPQMNNFSMHGIRYAESLVYDQSRLIGMVNNS